MEVTFDSAVGSSFATSYNSVSELQQYFFDNGYDYSPYSENDLKRYLNQASSYLDNEYRSDFPGIRDEDSQALEWPRIGAFYLDGFDISEDSIPVELKKATSEMVYLITQGYVPNAVISKSGKIVSETSKVDVITSAIEYEKGSTLYHDVYTNIDSILSRIIGSNSSFALTVLRTGGDSP